jgi:hypothetical protein
MPMCVLGHPPALLEDDVLGDPLLRKKKVRDLGEQIRKCEPYREDSQKM